MMFRHFLYIPFTGLGLYGGYRGDRWLRNRIKIFKQFVVPSLKNQSNQYFDIWVSWRPEERNNERVKELKVFLEREFPKRVVFTYEGVCFYDDKYPDKIARERLVTNLHKTMNTLINHVGDVNEVYMTIQPSDDCYARHMVADVHNTFRRDSAIQACGYQKGYLMNYQTKELNEYNPKTNPPFYTLRFTKEKFIDPYGHTVHTSLKKKVNQYEEGTPLPSHEYVPDCLKFEPLMGRGFLVGTHGENISTHFNHPYRGEAVDPKTLTFFGLDTVEPLKLKLSVRKWIMRHLPHPIRRKIRYYLGEKLYQSFYNFIRA